MSNEYRWNYVLIIGVTLCAIFWLSIAIALSASMEYCRPYATDVANKVVKRAWMRAYTKCVNASDEAPVAPTDDQALSVITLPPPRPDLSEPDIIPKPDLSGVGVVPAVAKLDPDKIPAPTVCGREASGFNLGTIEQTRWCKSYFKSFRPKDGTVVCKRTRKRAPCA